MVRAEILQLQPRVMDSDALANLCFGSKCCGGENLCLRRSLRGAKRRSNPSRRRRIHGLLRFARNDGAPFVIARLDRAIQYSRDGGDSIEKPRRTGSPLAAFAKA